MLGVVFIKHDIKRNCQATVKIWPRTRRVQAGVVSNEMRPHGGRRRRRPLSRGESRFASRGAPRPSVTYAHGGRALLVVCFDSAQKEIITIRKAFRTRSRDSRRPQRFAFATLEPGTDFATWAYWAIQAAARPPEGLVHSDGACRACLTVIPAAI
jgi:hypothetical protein